MNGSRAERLAQEIRQIVGQSLARQEIKDPRVRDAGLITVTHVRVTGDLRQGRIFFTVHGADEAGLERTRAGLTSASGFLKAKVGHNLSSKVIPHLTFEVDRAFEEGSRVEAILREVAPPVAPKESPDDPEGGSEPDSET